jgi:protein-tyrosine phosphatase
MENWTVSSAGTWVTRERGASQNSILVLADRGLDISDHQARGVSAQILAEADLILCMESGHAEALRVEFSEAADRIYMLSEMVGESYSIADPYGDERPAYERMAEEVETLITEGFWRIIELGGENARKRWGVRE